MISRDFLIPTCLALTAHACFLFIGPTRSATLVQYREEKGAIEVSLSRIQTQRPPIQRATSAEKKMSQPVHKPKPKKEHNPQLKYKPSPKPVPEPELESISESEPESTISEVPSLIEKISIKEYASASNQDGNKKIEEETGPTYLRNPKPRYPIIAKRRNIEGVVVLKVEVLPNGKVGNIIVLRTSGYSMLDKSALHAVNKWLFIPAKRNGKNIKIWREIPIRFELD